MTNKKTTAPGEVPPFKTPPQEADPRLTHDTSQCDQCCQPEISLKKAQAVGDATAYLLEAGLLPIFDRTSLRAAWRLSPEDQPALAVLASRYHQAEWVPR